MLAKRFDSAKNQGSTSVKKLWKKSHSAEKTQKGTLWSPLYYCKHIFCLVRGSNSRTPRASHTSSFGNPS